MMHVHEIIGKPRCLQLTKFQQEGNAKTIDKLGQVDKEHACYRESADESPCIILLVHILDHGNNQRSDNFDQGQFIHEFVGIHILK